MHGQQNIYIYIKKKPFMCFDGFGSEDDPLLLKQFAAVNTADNVVVLTVP